MGLSRLRGYAYKIRRNKRAFLALISIDIVFTGVIIGMILPSIFKAGNPAITIVSIVIIGFLILDIIFGLKKFFE